MNTILMFCYCANETVRQKVQVLHIGRNTSSCSDGTKFKTGLESGGEEEDEGYEKHIRQKRVPDQFKGAEQSESLPWLNSQAGEERFYCIDNYLDIRKDEREHE